MSAVVDLLQELVRIPSVNPQGDAGTPHVGEGEMAKFVGDYLVKLGMSVEMQFVEPNRPNVIGHLKSKNSRHHLLLGPHLDTVSVLGMTIDPFGGVLKDGRIWGRGACDTKGSMAAMLVALKNITRDEKIPQDTDIWFAGLMGEESGNDGIAYLMESEYFEQKGVKPSFGIAGEPTDLKIVHRHKGALWFRIRTRGKSCHASQAELGENAILKMRKAMDFVTSKLPQAYAKLKDRQLGKCSFNLTTFHGGSKINIIPDTCEIEVDHRSLPQEDHAEVIKRVKKSLLGCEVEVISDRPGLDTSAENPFIQKMLNVIAPGSDAMQRKSLVGAPWFGDCSVMSKHGVPAIAFGPGSIRQAHTKDEYIEVEELEKGVEVFQAFFENLD